MCPSVCVGLRVAGMSVLREWINRRWSSKMWLYGPVSPARRQCLLFYHHCCNRAGAKNKNKTRVHCCAVRRVGLSEYESKNLVLFSCLLEVQRCPKMKSSGLSKRGGGKGRGIGKCAFSDNEWITKDSCHPRAGSTRDSLLWVAHHVQRVFCSRPRLVQS